MSHIIWAIYTTMKIKVEKSVWETSFIFDIHSEKMNIAAA